MVGDAEKHLDLIHDVARLKEWKESFYFSDEQLRLQEKLDYMLHLILQQRANEVTNRIRERLQALVIANRVSDVSGTIHNVDTALQAQLAWFEGALQAGDSPVKCFRAWYSELARKLALLGFPTLLRASDDIPPPPTLLEE